MNQNNQNPYANINLNNRASNSENTIAYLRNNDNSTDIIQQPYN